MSVQHRPLLLLMLTPLKLGPRTARLLHNKAACTCLESMTCT